jgi:hypothetical protein
MVVTSKMVSFFYLHHLLGSFTVLLENNENCVMSCLLQNTKYGKKFCDLILIV